MRRLRALFSVFALVAVALLPGPSHACTAMTGAHRHGDAPLHRSVMHAGHEHGATAVDDRGRLVSHHPCKACSLACCAPATAAADAPVFVAFAPVRRLRPSRPVADRVPAEALAQRTLKPPTRSAPA